MNQAEKHYRLTEIQCRLEPLFDELRRMNKATLPDTAEQCVKQQDCTHHICIDQCPLSCGDQDQVVQLSARRPQISTSETTI